MKIIMLSGDSNISLVLNALRAGALAYVIKENSPEEIGRAIQSVMAGKAYFSAEVAAAIARHCRKVRWTPRAPPPKPVLSETGKATAPVGRPRQTQQGNRRPFECFHQIR